MTARNGVTLRALLIVSVTICSFLAKAQLVPQFTATPLSGCSPLIVNFTDQTAGNPVSWRWELGNATTSTNQNPSTTYFNPGTYTVKLVVRNAAGDADSITKTAYITVYAKPAVNFTGTPATGCMPLAVQFNSSSTAGSGTISSWQWDFGDGTFASTENPSHTYTAAGNFNVSLRVTNSFGCVTTLTKLQYIKVGSPVYADFTNSQPTNCDLPSTITFQNNSTGAGTLSYQWDFGDGNTSTQPNPSHTYTAAGTYTVTLIVTSSNGCSDTIVKTNAVTIGVVNASFTNPPVICENTLATFTNTSTPAPSSVSWDFGDATTSTAINPVKAYAAAGFYVIRMIARFGNCADTIYRGINVQPQPHADFTAAPLTSCSAPFTVNFNNNSTSGFSYQWDFGDGNTSTAFNPSHTYTQYGTFNVRLIVTNFQGCQDTIIRTAYVRIQAPEASINALPVRGCAPLTHTFSATVNSLDAVTGYEWDFGDGNTSTLPNPSHVFPAGVYTITLIIHTAGGCTDTVVMDKAVTSSIKPTANFIADPRDVCANVPVTFTDLSTGTVTQWLWSFGDGGTSTQQNPTHPYNDTGYFNVQLIVWNEGCPDTIQFDNYVHIKPPIANFAPGFVCTDKLTRVFTDQSIGADEWNWDFGDGNTSTVQNPVHTYAATGTYTVTLLVRNHTTGCEYVRTQTIRVVIEKADFTESQQVICRNTAITFTAQGSQPANVASYQWNFGDGGTGTGQNVSHTYTVSGTYSVRLILTDILGCKDTLLKPLHIQVDGPVAAFAPVATGNCSMSATFFNDHSTGDGTHPITSWVWNFGDGNTTTFTAPPFFHNYTTPGTYAVALKVTDSKGCTDSINHNASVVISKPVADFATPDTLSCPGKDINFTNRSTGPGLTYKWDFGDATTSTSTSPSHQYAADGNYIVQLIATDQYGCTDTTEALVKIATPYANFSMSDSVSTCPPLVVNFTNTSANAISVNWDFGDGTSTQSDNPSHFYTYPGVYNVKLTITSNGGCTSELTKQVIVNGPKGNFTYAPLVGCSPLQVTFTATTENRLSFVWDFNDGNILATNDSIVTYTFTDPGKYVPKMILIDAGGCQVPITGPDTIFVKGVTAKFDFVSPTLCDKGTVTFTESSVSNDGITGYEWDFGDGGTSTQQNPAHAYTAPGLYYPRLVVTTLSGCTDTLVHATPVKIVASPQADIVMPASGCAPLTATFSGTIAADTSSVTWHWNLGNGNISTQQNPPSQVYTTAGPYPVELIVTNSSGCADTVQQTIEAYRVPVVNAGIDTMVCRGSGVTLVASGADNYTWGPATGLSCTVCPNPVASPSDTTDYYVTGTTIHGCSNNDTVKVNVKQPFTMRNSPGDTLCKGGSLRLFASGANTYAWSPAAGLSNTTSPSPIASPSTTTTYMVVGTDEKRCFKDTGYITIKVYAAPTIDAGADKTINVGQSVTLTPVVSADVINVTWTPTTGIVSSNPPSVTVQPKETTNYLVEATNAGGCKSRDNVTVFVLCNGANIFIPNTFSPNGDGANDVFYPRGTGLFNIKTLRIFNRWGEVVFEKGGFAANDASYGWDGTYKGVPLTPDVYVYTVDVLCDNKTILTLKGNVALIR